MKRALPIVAIDYDRPTMNETIEAMNGHGAVPEIRRVRWQALTAKTRTTGNIQAFLNYIFNRRGGTLAYCENLHIIGTHIVKKLLRQEYFPSTDFIPKDGKFTVLAQDIGKWYSIKITSKETGKTFELRDIRHLLPVDDATMKKSFGGNTPLETLLNAAEYLKDNGFTKSLTMGSAALAQAKGGLGDLFTMTFPRLDARADEFCRKAYRAGFMYAKHGTYESGICYDVNQLYPWILTHCDLPYGAPRPADAEELERAIDDGFLAIARVKFSGRLKKRKMPFLITKSVAGSDIIYNVDTPRVFVLTSVEIKEIWERYNLDEFEISEGFVFSQRSGFFHSFVNRNYQRKLAAETQAERTLAKLLNNSLIGKFGAKPTVTHIVVHDDGTYSKAQDEAKTLYVPLAAFVNAYGRVHITREAQRAEDINSIVYMDTDSIFTTTPIAAIETGSEMGKFKIEKEFDRLAVNTVKQYAWHNADGWHLTIAGMPKGVLNSRRDVINSDDAFIRKFTCGFDVEMVSSSFTEGVYGEAITTFHIGA